MPCFLLACVYLCSSICLTSLTFIDLQAAKKVYESLLGDGANATALSHIQVRFYIFLLYVYIFKKLKLILFTIFMGYKQFYVNMQFIRFLRRTEGVEAARKHFMDARKSPNCTYHVYVAYATMAFCMDKDAKVNVSESIQFLS